MKVEEFVISFQKISEWKLRLLYRAVNSALAVCRKAVGTLRVKMKEKRQRLRAHSDNPVLRNKVLRAPPSADNR